MKKKYLFILFTVLFYSIYSQSPTDLTTWFEKSEYLETPDYESTIQYCKALAANSKFVRYTEMGKSAQGRAIPILIIDKNGLSAPSLIRAKGRSIVLIQTCVHAGEPDGKDDGFLLIRDLINKKK